MRNKRVAKQFFEHPENCFVIMTAGASVSGIWNQFDLRYHTYVIDAMAELQTRELSSVILEKMEYHSSPNVSCECRLGRP